MGGGKEECSQGLFPSHTVQLMLRMGGSGCASESATTSCTAPVCMSGGMAKGVPWACSRTELGFFDQFRDPTTGLVWSLRKLVIAGACYAWPHFG